MGRHRHRYANNTHDTECFSIYKHYSGCMVENLVQVRSDGVVTIPKPIRDEYDIDYGDRIRIELKVNGDD
jgi:hypothetical protein